MPKEPNRYLNNNKRAFRREPVQLPARWYERYSNINLILKTVRFLPKPVQVEVIGRVNVIVARYMSVALHKKLHRMSNEPEKDIFIHLKKSYEKKRWYDKVSELHFLLNEMVFLPDAVLRVINEDCESVVGYIYSISGHNWELEPASLKDDSKIVED